MESVKIASEVYRRRCHQATTNPPPEDRTDEYINATPAYLPANVEPAIVPLRVYRRRKTQPVVDTSVLLPPTQHLAFKAHYYSFYPIKKSQEANFLLDAPILKPCARRPAYTAREYSRLLPGCPSPEKKLQRSEPATEDIPCDL